MKEKIKTIRVRAKFADDSKEEMWVEIYPDSLGKDIRKEDVTEERIVELLKKMRPSAKPMQINSLVTQFSYVEDIPKSEDGFNTRIFIRLPYHLPLPQGLLVQSDSIIPGQRIGMAFSKHWTDKAEGSEEIEAVTDKVLYYTNGTITTPQMPQDGKLGYIMQFTGENVERDKDSIGYFRYSQVCVLLNTSYSKEELEEEKKGDKLTELRNLSVSAINKTLDVYKFVMQEEYIERLGHIAIDQIYFVDHNLGYYFSFGSDYGIRSAMINRSRDEIGQFSDYVSQGYEPPVSDLVLLESESSYIRKDYKSSVIKAFQGLEIFLENFLTSKLLRKGLSEDEAKTKLEEGNNWRLKNRLTSVLQEICDKNMNKSDTWEEWCTLYDKVRHDVVHRNKDISEEKTRRIIDINKKIIKLVQT